MIRHRVRVGARSSTNQVSVVARNVAHKAHERIEELVKTCNNNFEHMDDAIRAIEAKL